MEIGRWKGGLIAAFLLVGGAVLHEELAKTIEWEVGMWYNMYRGT